jgi:hypothetical protein
VPVERSTVTRSIPPSASSRNPARSCGVGENPLVTRLAYYDTDDWEELWWVRADGRAEVLTEQR